jgi:hypothetical protein
MKNKRRIGMKMILNKGQWHTNVDRMHTWDNGDWCIVFRKNGSGCGHLDNVLGASLKVSIPVEVMPTKEDALKYGLTAFTMTGEKAQLIMRNELGV